MTYQYDDTYQFHYQTAAGITCLCMSDAATTKHRVAAAFLNQLMESLVAAYGTEAPLQAIAFSYNESFAPTIATLMQQYNTQGVDDNIAQVQSQLDTVRQSMVQNIEQVLERGERIELLVDKTDRLNQQAFRFESSSRQLRNALYWRRIRLLGAVATAVLLVLLVGTMSMCGGVTFSHCKKH